MRVFHAAIFNYIDRVDLFATYAYSCRICPLECFIVLSLKTKNSSGQMRQLSAYVANESTHSYICILAYCRLVIPSLKFQMLRDIVDVLREYNPFNEEFEEEQDGDYEVCI